MRRIVKILVLSWFSLCVLLHQAFAQEKYAGIEVGSRGVKFVVFQILTDKNGERTPKELPGTGDDDEVKNSGLNDSAAVTQTYSESAITETIAAIKTFVDRAQQERVPSANILIVGSSGLRDAKNRDVFSERVAAATKHEIKFISHTHEVALTFLDVCPKPDRDRSFSLDIGSGNTKFGYMQPLGDGTWTPHAAQIIWGTGTFRDEVKSQVKFSNPTDPAASAANFADCAKQRRGALQLDANFAKKQQTVEGLSGRRHVYLSGGIAWACATIVKPASAGESEVALSLADISNFKERVRLPVDKLFASVDLSGVPPAHRDTAQKELASVRKIFAKPKDGYTVPHADLIAGAELLDAAAKAFDFSNCEIVFPRKALTAWIRSYVLHNADIRLTTNQPAQPEVGGAGLADLPAKVDALAAQLDTVQQQLLALTARPKADALPGSSADSKAQRERLDRIEQRLVAIARDQELIKSNLTTLRKAIDALRQESTQKRSSLSPAAADTLFYTGLAHYHNGRFTDSYRSFRQASDAQDIPQYWFGRSLAAWQLNFSDDFRASAQRAGHLTRSGSVTYEDVCRLFSRVQGPARLAADGIMRTSR